MSTQLLINVLTVTVPGSDSVTVPHGLKSNGVSVAPKLVLPAGASPVSAGTITDTSITFNNAAAYPVTATFRVERGVSVEVDAEVLETVRVASADGADGSSGEANALRPIRTTEGGIGYIPIYPLGGGAILTGEGNTWYCAGPQGADSGQIGPYMLMGATGPAKNNIAWRGGTVDIDPANYAPPEMRFDGGQFALGTGWNLVDNYRLPMTVVAGDITFTPYPRGGGGTKYFRVDGLAYGVDGYSPIPGLSINVYANTVVISGGSSVNLNGVSPQIQTEGIREGTLLTLTIADPAVTVTLTNAAGGQMKLKTSPLVINPYEAYDFVFAGGFWIQR